MQKTRLGISVGLFGAAMYFMGMISIIPLAIVAGYALMFEQSAWLRKSAVKAVGVVLFFTVISTVIGLLGNAEFLIEEIARLFGDGFNLAWYDRILSIARTVVSLAESLLLLMMGMSAFRQGNVGLGPVDKAINENM